MTEPLDVIAEAHRHWKERGWAAADAMAAATSIMRAQQLVQARVDEVLRPLGLTFARYEALALLYVSSRGALPLGKMGTRLMVHPTSVTNAVDRLERDSLVRRVRHPTDGRTRLAEITPRGRALVERATAALGSVRYGIDRLDDAEARSLTELITRLRERRGDFSRKS
jgi:DNA-binding MarR family transcriptional regulator